MFGTQRSGANAYAKVGVETGVLAASPYKLIAMLFDGAMTALSIAQVNMRTGNIAAKGQAISKATRIIEEGLRASLDKDAGGGIAVSLDALYEYMSSRLLQGNLQNDVEMIAEVHRLLGELKSAWEGIDPAAVSLAAVSAPSAAAASAVASSASLAAYGTAAARPTSMIKA